MAKDNKEKPGDKAGINNLLPLRDLTSLSPTGKSMRYRFFLTGFLLLPLMKMGKTSFYTPGKEADQKTIISFLKSPGKKKASSQMVAFWETAIQDNSSIDTAALKQSNWYADAMKTINRKEYEINYNTQLKAYTSPNRNHNLRAFYSSGLFTMMPRDESTQKWKLALQLNGIYAGKKKVYTPAEHPVVTLAANTIRFNNNEQFITEYINSADGIRQNFIINSKPEADAGKITVQLEAGKEWFVNKVAKTELHFARKAPVGKITEHGLDKKLTYNGLKAWDANGKTMEASFVVFGNKINIDVITKDVLYPVTIDPISTTANWSIESNQAGANLGYSVHSAGDVNGDGYSDVIAGSPLYDNGQTDEGRVFVYHGSATGLSATAAWSAESDIAGARMGYSSNTAGDVNGDGYSDVIVGAGYLTNGETNEGRAYVYHGSASGLQLTAAWMIESNQAGAYFGSVVSCAGDVNGDGYSDVIVGSPQYDNGQTDEGAAFVYHGSASGLSVTANWSGESDQVSASYGGTAIGLIGTGNASAGDVNGDGYSDIIITAVDFDNGQINEGRAYVYHGSASGLSLTAAWTFESDQASARLGNAATSAGDVNGDGYGDVVVGAHAYNNGQAAEGRAYVFYGSATGLATSAAWVTESNLVNAQHGCSVGSIGDVNNDGYSDIVIGELQYTNGQSSEGAALAYFGSATGLPLTANWTVEPNVVSALFGCSVASAGDVNGDGYSDVIVGALNYNNGQASEGAAFVYHGSASGIGTTVNNTLESNQALAFLGASVASAGDVNGDGYGDVIVGSVYFDNGQTDEGAAFVFHGSATGVTNTIRAQLEINQADARMGASVACAGDVNGDGYSDVIVGGYQYTNGQTNEGAAFVYHGSATGISTTIQTQLELNQAFANMGSSVASAGDVNGDGYSDVIVGANQYTNGQSGEGAAFVYHGSATGINTTIRAQLECNQVNAFYGTSVAGAGDVNGDGYSDVIVGARGFDNGNTDEGAAFVYHGSVTGITSTIQAQLEPNQNNYYFGWCVSSAGDVNGDGYSDVIVGAWGYDNGQSDEGAAYVYHGSATGINTTVQAQFEPNLANAHMGWSLASAGDVNGDGYSDIVLGVLAYANGESNEGEILVYHGSSSGINPMVQAQVESNQVNGYMGYSVASAGDVNGDGFSDIIVGVQGYTNGQTSEGAAFIYLGNNGGGKRNNLRLYNTDLTTPIQQTNKNDPNLFGAGLFIKSPLGRTKAKLVWEVKAQGQPFSGSSITNSTGFLAKQPSFTNLGIAGTELKYNVAKQGSQNKIRVRVEYDKATAITGQVYGPWKYPPGYTMGAYGMNAVPLPLQLVSFAGRFINKNDVELQWKTANEINMQQFIVERSENAVNFIATGILPAKGTGAGTAHYSFIDRNMNADILYYRLKLKEQNGEISYSHIITLSRIKNINGFIAPNPVNINTEAILTINSSANNIISISVLNIAGLLIFEKNALLINGRNDISIGTRGLPRGIYVVSVSGKNIKQNYNLIIQ